MRKCILLVALLAAAGAQAQTVDATGQATSGSQSGATAGNVNNFAAAEQRGRISTTAPVYVAPAMFGGANNCGQSDTMGVSVTGFGIGGARSGESAACNAREDTAIAYKLGMPDVAKMRFLCFGESANRMAFEATGGVCPEKSTAKGLASLDVKPQPGYMP